MQGGAQFSATVASGTKELACSVSCTKAPLPGAPRVLLPEQKHLSLPYGQSSSVCLCSQARTLFHNYWHNLMAKIHLGSALAPSSKQGTMLLAPASMDSPGFPDHFRSSRGHSVEKTKVKNDSS